MPNPLHKITQVFKDHFTCEDKDVYIDTIRMIDYAATELDRFDYETDGEGEKIYNDLLESLDEYEKSQREDEDAEPEVDEDDDIERNKEDLDDDDEPSTGEVKVT